MPIFTSIALFPIGFAITSLFTAEFPEISSTLTSTLGGFLIATAGAVIIYKENKEKDR